MTTMMRITDSALQHWLLRWTMATALVLAVVLPQHAAQATDLSRRVSFNIPAQPLPAALLQFSSQSGVEFTVATESVEGRQAVELKGTYATDQALGLLLAGSGLEFEPINNGTVAIRRVGEKTAGSAAENPDAAGAVLAQAETASPSHAEGEGAPKGADEDKSKIQEVIVTAQKRKENLQDVPISMSVLSGTELDRSSLTSVTDAINQVPGVVASVAIQGGGTQMSIRGVGAAAPRNAGPSPVAYYLDWSPFGTVGYANGPDANPYDLERIEVLRGPQGTLYGASGQGGVVRILTHDADLNNFEFKSRARVSDTEGGASNYGGDMALNVPLIEGKLAARLVVGYEDQSGWVDQAIENNVNDAQLRNYRLKINSQPTEQLSIGLSAWSVRNDWGANSASADDGTSPALMQEPITSDYDLYGVRVGYDFANVSLTSVTSYLNYDNTYLQDLRHFDIPGLTVFLSDPSEVFSEELILNSTGSNVWKWTAGAFYRHADQPHFQFVIDIPSDAFPPIVSVDTAQTSESAALFGEVTRLFFNGELEWTVGLRYFRDTVEFQDNNAPTTANSDSFESTTPRTVLTWHPSDDVMIYGSYSEGFRSGYPQGVVPPASQYPPVKPDLLSNYEIGTKANLWNDRLSLDAAVYFLDWQDVQLPLYLPYVIGPNTTCCESVLINSDSASGFGTDFGATLRPLDGLELGVTLSWNDLTMDQAVEDGNGVLYAKGDRLNYSAEYTAGLNGSYEFPLGGRYTARLAASANYSSAQYEHVRSTEPAEEGDDLLVVRSSFTLDAGNGWTAMLFGENLTDESGGPPGNALTLIPRIRPRTIGVQVDYRFGN